MDFIELFFLFVVVPIWAMCFYYKIKLSLMGYKFQKRKDNVDHKNDWVVNDEIQRQWDEKHKK